MSSPTHIHLFKIIYYLYFCSARWRHGGRQVCICLEMCPCGQHVAVRLIAILHSIEYVFVVVTVTHLQKNISPQKSRYFRSCNCIKGSNAQAAQKH